MYIMNQNCMSLAVHRKCILLHIIQFFHYTLGNFLFVIFSPSSHANICDFIHSISLCLFRILVPLSVLVFDIPKTTKAKLKWTKHYKL